MPTGFVTAQQVDKGHGRLEVDFTTLYQQQERNLAALQQRFAYHFERILLHLDPELPST